MRSYGPRNTPAGEQTIRTPSAVSLEISTTLWSRQLTGGSVRCELLRGTGTKETLVIAEYRDRGRQIQAVCRCTTLEQEARAARRYERRIRNATAAATQEHSSPAPAPAEDPSAPEAR